MDLNKYNKMDYFIIFSGFSFGFFFGMYFIFKTKNIKKDLLLFFVMTYLNIQTNIEIFYNKNIKFYINTFYNNNIFYYLKTKEHNINTKEVIEFIKNGVITHECSKEEFICLEKDYFDYDFFVYTTINNEKIIRTFNKNNKITDKSIDIFNYIVSNTKFIYCNLTITFLDFYNRQKTENIEIQINNKEYNFCIVDNIIDLNFIIYYLNFINTKIKNRFYINFNETNITKYELCIIDDSTNYIILNNKKKLIFLEDKYLLDDII